MYPRNLAVGDLDPCHRRLLVDLDAALIGTARVGPGHRIVAGDRPRRMIEGANNGRLMAATGQIDLGNGLFYKRGIYHLGIDAEMLIDLGAPALGAQRRRSVGQSEMAALGVEQIEVERTREIAVKIDAKLVKTRPFFG